MNTAKQDIVVEEVLPHAPETIWKTLTTSELIGRWLMKSTGFEPWQARASHCRRRRPGPWDGVIHCEVLEVMRNEHLSYSWRGGHDGNAEYGSRLDTIVTWTFAKVDVGKAACRAFRLRTAEERHRIPEFERRLEEGGGQDRRHFRRARSLTARAGAKR